GSGIGSSTTLSTFGVRFGSQYALFASSSSRSRGTNRVSLNGPAPDGCSANLRQSFTLLHRAGDTITMYTMWYGTQLVTVGVSRWIVVSSACFTASRAESCQWICAEPYWSKCAACLFLIESNVKMTASALNGLPSWSFTFLRRWKTHFFGSLLLTSHD